jgi:hypothetical protein
MKRKLREITDTSSSLKLSEKIQRIQEQFDNLTQDQFNTLVSRILATNIVMARISNGETGITIDFSDDATHEEFTL